MHQEKYSLKWHTYSDHLKSMMKELMINEDFSDVTLVTEDKQQIKANINVLSACSPVFKDILKKEKNSNQIIYLRGIQFSEMESILQYIYLGEATFYEERMNEFLAVARSLEIKELCKAETERNEETDDETLPTNPVSSTETVDEQTLVSDQITNQALQDNIISIIVENVESGNKDYECDQCHKTYSKLSNLKAHQQSVHQGVKYACHQCDYQATIKSSLKKHIQSMHEGVKYDCDQCDHQFANKSNLSQHIKNKHEGVKYSCRECDYQAAKQSCLTRHSKAKH